MTVGSVKAQIVQRQWRTMTRGNHFLAQVFMAADKLGGLEEYFMIKYLSTYRRIIMARNPSAYNTGRLPPNIMHKKNIRSISDCLNAMSNSSYRYI